MVCAPVPPKNPFVHSKSKITRSITHVANLHRIMLLAHLQKLGLFLGLVERVLVLDVLVAIGQADVLSRGRITIDGLV